MPEELVPKGTLGDIGFVEFTVGLINGVIDALIAANHNQIQQFIELLQESAQTLEHYTANYIADQELALVGAPTIGPTTSLTPDQVKALAGLVPSVSFVTTPTSGPVIPTNETLLNTNGDPDTTALSITGTPVTGGAFKVDTSITGHFLPNGAETATALQAALKAALTATASGQYQALQQMVKMGFSRIILDSGVIETRLTFNASRSSSTTSSSSSVQSSQFGVGGSVTTRGKLAKFIGLSVSSSFSKVSLNMSNQVHRDVSGSSVQIFGKVELHLKSDFMPLSK